jgi:aminomethyltransferase
MRTPLFPVHKKLGARFTDFHGWEMPLEFSSAVKEALSVRQSSGIFDISHMGRLRVRGEDARSLLENLTTNRVSRLTDGRVQYTLFTSERGTVLDDATLYRISENSYLICVNASNREKILGWIRKKAGEMGFSRLVVEDLSPATVQIALQGPQSADILSELYPVGDLSRYRFKTFGDIIISRTGYTGEDGFEIYAPRREGVDIYLKLLKKTTPCGLASRDILRIEAGFPLYGNELSEDITPLEAGLDRFVDLGKDFVGSEPLRKADHQRVLRGVRLEERGIPRRGYSVMQGSEKVGTVSSGTYSPSLGCGIALAFVKKELPLGTPVEILIRNRRVRATLTRTRFI